jgi:hypothetical protein
VCGCGVCMCVVCVGVCVVYVCVWCVGVWCVGVWCVCGVYVVRWSGVSYYTLLYHFTNTQL